MHWIAPSAKDSGIATLEKRLWDTADHFRANSGLKAQEYSSPILGLIFLRFAEVRFAAQQAKLEAAGASSRRGSRIDDPAAYHAEGILYLAESPRVLRRLLLLREWSHEEETESIYPSRSGASCTFGIRATAGTSIDVVDHRINRPDDRMCATDLA